MASQTGSQRVAIAVLAAVTLVLAIGTSHGTAGATTGQSESTTIAAPYADAGQSTYCDGFAFGDDTDCVPFAVADQASGELAAAVAMSYTWSRVGCDLPLLWIPCIDRFRDYDGGLPGGDNGAFYAGGGADAWVAAAHDLPDVASAVDYAVTITIPYAEAAAASVATCCSEATADVGVLATVKHATCTSCTGSAGQYVVSARRDDLGDTPAETVSERDLTFIVSLANDAGGPIPPGRIEIRTELWVAAYLSGDRQPSHSTASAEATAVVRQVVASVRQAPDLTAPETTVASGPPTLSNSRGATFELVSSEAGSTFTCQLDGGPSSPCTSPATYTDLGDGSHSFEAVATDAAGNTDASPASWSWTVDATAPDTTITAGPPLLTNQTSAALSFEATEAGATFACRLDGGAVGACESPTTYAGLADGNHVFEVRSTDTAGNADPTPVSRSWTVDSTPPGAPTLTGPADGSSTADAKPTFDWSDVTDASGVTYQIEVDNNGNMFPSPEVSQTGLSASTFTPAEPLAVATYSWRVRTVDAAGNTGAWSATWNVAITAPPGSIAGTVTSQTNRKALAGATVNCGSAGIATTTSSGTYSITNVSPGSYTCTASASGHKTASKSVTVKSNATTIADFVLRRV